MVHETQHKMEIKTEVLEDSFDKVAEFSRRGTEGLSEVVKEETFLEGDVNEVHMDCKADEHFEHEHKSLEVDNAISKCVGDEEEKEMKSNMKRTPVVIKIKKKCTKRTGPSAVTHEKQKGNENSSNKIKTEVQNQTCTIVTWKSRNDTPNRSTQTSATTNNSNKNKTEVHTIVTWKSRNDTSNKNTQTSATTNSTKQ